MGGARLTEHLWFVYGPSEGRTVYLRPVGRPYGSFTARWKAVRFIVRFTLRAVSRTYGQLGAPFGRQPRRYLGRNFLCISFVFTVLLKQLWRLYTSGFIFQVPPVYDYSTCCTNHVPTRSVHQPLFTRSVHQPLAYASGALMKQLLIRGRHQYIYYVVCFNIKDSHHPNEHTILYVFRAPGYDSIVSLN